MASEPMTPNAANLRRWITGLKDPVLANQYPLDMARNMMPLDCDSLQDWLGNDDIMGLVFHWWMWDYSNKKIAAHIRDWCAANKIELGEERGE
jgi:hypothetical protein